MISRIVQVEFCVYAEFKDRSEAAHIVVCHWVSVYLKLWEVCLIILLVRLDAEIVKLNFFTKFTKEEFCHVFPVVSIHAF